jgi:hypothetical protein
MTKDTARALRARAEDVAKKFSYPDRKHNVNGESFKVHDIILLSAQTALVTYEKTTGKRAIAFFYHIMKQERWEYFFLGAQHMLNLDKIPGLYMEVENHNFKYNFPDNSVIDDILNE